jgi:hypothetical protein
MPVSTSRPPIAFDQTEMRLEACQERGEWFDRERCDDERHAEAERIDCEHAGAHGDRRFGGRDREDPIRRCGLPQSDIADGLLR